MILIAYITIALLHTSLMVPCAIKTSFLPTEGLLWSVRQPLSNKSSLKEPPHTQTQRIERTDLLETQRSVDKKELLSCLKSHCALFIHKINTLIVEYACPYMFLPYTNVRSKDFMRLTGPHSTHQIFWLIGTKDNGFPLIHSCTLCLRDIAIDDALPSDWDRDAIADFIRTSCNIPYAQETMSLRTNDMFLDSEEYPFSENTEVMINQLSSLKIDAYADYQPIIKEYMKTSAIILIDTSPQRYIASWQKIVYYLRKIKTDRFKTIPASTVITHYIQNKKIFDAIAQDVCQQLTPIIYQSE